MIIKTRPARPQCDHHRSVEHHGQPTATEAEAVRSEREKMLAGELYFAGDPELAAARLVARRLVSAFNASDPADVARRTSLLHELLGRIGDGVEIEPDLRCDYGFNIRLGANTFINFGCVLLDCAEIEIGEHCLLGPGVHLYTATHPLDPEVRVRGFEYARPIRLGAHVWIGGGAIVLPGVTIGDHAVVGAGSVVTRDVSAGTVVAGNPARMIQGRAAGAPRP
jgi:maltose O-acetyltransferase